MRTAKVYMHNNLAGYLTEVEKNKKYTFTYEDNYKGEPISLTMPVEFNEFNFNSFPLFLMVFCLKVYYNYPGHWSPS
mgnify:CR=1 FL=1